MGKLLIICVLLLIAAWIGWEVHQDPGYVLINFRHWQIETNVGAAILLVLFAFIVAYMLLRLFVRLRRWPRQWRQRRDALRQKRAQQLAEIASCELIEEKWQKAEQSFQQAAAIAQRPLPYYMAAAVAATAQGNSTRSEGYLRKAYETTPQAEITLGILQAKLQIQNQQWPQARITLEKLNAAVPQHPAVKKLLSQVYDYLIHNTDKNYSILK